MKNFLFITLLILFIIGCTSNNQEINNDVIQNVDDVNSQSVQISSDALPEEPIVPKLKAIDCKAEQRKINGCIEIYKPVCGQVMTQCITTPCNPIKETFENSCKACVNPNVLSYTEGECSESDEIKK